MENEKRVRRLVIREMPHFWSYAVVSFLAALLLQLVELFPPFIMGKIVDEYIPGGDAEKIFVSITLLAGIPSAAILGKTLYHYMLNVTGRKFGCELTIMGFRTLICQPMDYFDRHNSGELAAYCKSEAMKYVTFWLFDIPQTLAGVLSGIIALGLLAAASPPAALLAVIYIPVVIIPGRTLAKKMEKHVQTIVEKNASANQTITDTFRGIKFVKAMVLEEERIAALRRIIRSTVRTWSRVAMFDNLNGSWTGGFVDNVFYGVIFAVGAILIIRGSMTLGVLLLVLNLLPVVFRTVRTIASANYDFHQQSAEFDKLFALITMESEEKRGGSGAVPAACTGDAVRFENVSFAYPGNRGEVLRDLSFSVKSGEWVGIIGKSGVGKSSILDLVIGLYEYGSGEIYLYGRPLRELDRLAVRGAVTKISQETFLFPGTIRENLRLVRADVSDAEIGAVLEQVGLSALIRGLPEGVDTNIGEDGWQLSGGEKHRLCLALGLLRRSSILLLDEVTASLDPANADSLRELVRRLNKEQGMTVISVSHSYAFLEDADRVLEIVDGAVKA